MDEYQSDLKRLAGLAQAATKAILSASKCSDANAAADYLFNAKEPLNEALEAVDDLAKRLETDEPHELVF